MGISLNRKKLFFLIAVILVLIYSLSLSPQWCLSRKKVWVAEELDMKVYISDEYNPSVYEMFTLFDRNEMNEYFTGQINVNGQVSEFSFFPEDQFKWIRFGNDLGVKYEVHDDSWTVTGELKSVYNPNKIKIIILGSYGDYFPKDIKTITLIPFENTGDGSLS